MMYFHLLKSSFLHILLATLFYLCLNDRGVFSAEQWIFSTQHWQLKDSQKIMVYDGTTYDDSISYFIGSMLKRNMFLKIAPKENSRVNLMDVSKQSSSFGRSFCFWAAFQPPKSKADTNHYVLLLGSYVENGNTIDIGLEVLNSGVPIIYLTSGNKRLEAKPKSFSLPQEFTFSYICFRIRITERSSMDTKNTLKIDVNGKSKELEIVIVDDSGTHKHGGKNTAMPYIGSANGGNLVWKLALLRIFNSAEECCVPPGCEKNKCSNNGTCSPSYEASPSFACFCTEEYSGAFCEDILTVCSKKPCKNGGTCEIIGGNNFTCLCPPGVFGNLCEKPEIPGSTTNERMSELHILVKTSPIYVSESMSFALVTGATGPDPVFKWDLIRRSNGSVADSWETKAMNRTSDTSLLKDYLSVPPLYRKNTTSFFVEFHQMVFTEDGSFTVKVTGFTKGKPIHTTDVKITVMKLLAGFHIFSKSSSAVVNTSTPFLLISTEEVPGPVNVSWNVNGKSWIELIAFTRVAADNMNTRNVLSENFGKSVKIPTGEFFYKEDNKTFSEIGEISITVQLFRKANIIDHSSVHIVVIDPIKYFEVYPHNVSTYENDVVYFVSVMSLDVGKKPGFRWHLSDKTNFLAPLPTEKDCIQCIESIVGNISGKIEFPQDGFYYWFYNHSFPEAGEYVIRVTAENMDVEVITTEINVNVLESMSEIFLLTKKLIVPVNEPVGFVLFLHQPGNSPSFVWDFDSELSPTPTTLHPYKKLSNPELFKVLNPSDMHRFIPGTYYFIKYHTFDSDGKYYVQVIGKNKGKETKRTSLEITALYEVRGLQLFSSDSLVVEGANVTIVVAAVDMGKDSSFELKTDHEPVMKFTHLDYAKTTSPIKDLVGLTEEDVYTFRKAGFYYLILNKTLTESKTYNFTLIAYNKGMITGNKNLSISVVEQICSPNITVTNVGDALSTAISYHRRDAVIIGMEANLQCDHRLFQSRTWTLYNVTGEDENPTLNENNKIELPTSVTADSRLLEIPPKFLTFGTYLVKLVLVVNQKGRSIIGTGKGWFKVFVSPLQAKIIGGKTRSHNFKDELIIDGSESKNPNGDTLTYTWFCVSTPEEDPANLCKGMQVPLPYPESILKFLPHKFNPLTAYTFKLKVSSDDPRERISEYEQTIFIGRISSLQINCLFNCREKVNSKEKLVLLGVCKNCLNYKFTWSLINIDKPGEDIPIPPVTTHEEITKHPYPGIRGTTKASHRGQTTEVTNVTPRAHVTTEKTNVTGITHASTEETTLAGGTYVTTEEITVTGSIHATTEETTVISSTHATTEGTTAASSQTGSTSATIETTAVNPPIPLLLSNVLPLSIENFTQTTPYPSIAERKEMSKENLTLSTAKFSRRSNRKKTSRKFRRIKRQGHANNKPKTKTEKAPPGSYKWVPYSKFGIGGDIFHLKPNYLTQGDRYAVTLKVETSDNEEATATYMFAVNESPKYGFCLVTPTDGESLRTIYTIACQGYVDDDVPLSYQFYFKNDYDLSSGVRSTLTAVHEGIVLKRRFDPHSREVIIPIGNPHKNYTGRVTVAITDYLGMSAETHINVTVRPPKDISEREIDSIINSRAPGSINDQLDVQGDIEAALNLANCVGMIINSQYIAHIDYKDKAKFRHQLIQKFVDVPQMIFGYVKELITTLNIVLKGDPKEIPTPTAEMASNLMYELTESLNETIEKEALNMEQVQETAILAFGVSSSLLRVTVGTESYPTVLPQPFANTVPPMSADKLQKCSIAKKVVGIISDVSDTLLKQQTTGDQDLHLDTDDLGIWLRKTDNHHDSSFYLGHKGDDLIRLPTLQTLGINDSDRHSLDMKMVTSPLNPFICAKNADIINVHVIGLAIEESTSKIKKSIRPQAGNSKLMEVFVRRRGTAEAVTCKITTKGLPRQFTPDNLLIQETNITTSNRAIHILVNRTDPYFALLITWIFKEEPTLRDFDNSYLVPPNGKFDFMISLLPSQVSISKGTYYIGILPYTTGIAGLLERNDKEQAFNSSMAPEMTHFNLSVFESRCLYYEASEENWSEEGCDIGPNTNVEFVHCICNHMSVFSASFLVSPNFINLNKIPELFARAKDNLVIIICMIVVWTLYLIGLIWATVHDRRDYNKRGIIILEDYLPHEDYGYVVAFYTGIRQDAGTTATAFIQIHGTRSNSRTRMMTTKYRKVMETGGEDWFYLRTEDCLGEVIGITVWHSNEGARPEWYLSQVRIKDVQTGSFWICLVNRWLTKEKKRGSLRYYIAPLSRRDMAKFGIVFKRRAVGDLRERHLWFSIFVFPTRSHFTRAQRLTCAFSLTLVAMLINLMFYGVNVTDIPEVVRVGYFKFSLGNFIIGLQSSAMAYPFGYVIMEMFTNIKPRFGDEEQINELLNIAEEGDIKSGTTLSLPFSELSGEPRGSMTSLYKEEKEAKPTKPDSDDTKGLFAYHFWRDDRLNYIPLKSKVPFENELRYRTGTNYLSIRDEMRENIQELEDDPKVKFSNWLWDQRDEDYPRPLKTRLKFAHYEVLSTIDMDRPGRRCKQCFLPWWFVYIAWIIIMVISFSCTFFIILYGLSYGYERSLDWLKSTVTSFFQSTVIFDPFQVIVFALVLTYCVELAERI